VAEDKLKEEIVRANGFELEAVLVLIVIVHERLEDALVIEKVLENPELAYLEYFDTLAFLGYVKWGRFQRLGLGH
jgi:hypothetical protein